MTKRSYSPWWLTGAIALILVTAFGLIYLTGWVNGEEFCPDDFSRRHFTYCSSPILKITFRGIKYNDSTPVFEQTLFSDGFLGTPPPVKTWHLVSDSVSDNRSADFDARFLCRFLDIKDENGESIWIRWNENFPHLAKQFWPIIADLARHSLYIDASKIMLRASNIEKSDIDSFKKYMNQTAANSFLKKAASDMKNQKYQEAIPLFSKSIEYKPSKTAYLGRSECYQQTGQNQKSVEDKKLATGDDDQ